MSVFIHSVHTSNNDTSSAPAFNADAPSHRLSILRAQVCDSASKLFIPAALYGIVLLSTPSKLSTAPSHDLYLKDAGHAWTMRGPRVGNESSGISVFFDNANIYYNHAYLLRGSRNNLLSCG